MKRFVNSFDMRPLIDTILLYVSPQDLVDHLVEQHKLTAVEMDSDLKLTQSDIDDAFEKGIDIGYSEGYDEGLKDGATKDVP